MANNATATVCNASARRPSPANALIDSIATCDFHARLSDVAEDSFGSSQGWIFEFRDGQILHLEPFGRSVSSRFAPDRRPIGDHYIRQVFAARMTEAAQRASPMPIRIDPSRIGDLAARDAIYRRHGIRDIAILWGARAGSVHAIAIIRSKACDLFSSDDLDEMGEMAESLVSAAAKHAQIVAQRRSPVLGLMSPDRIKDIISSGSAKLPRRELEVCSYILHGVSMAGIASILGIAEESVVTYRKRAYCRLGIASRQDLLLWYLSLAADGTTESSTARVGARAFSPRLLERPAA